MPIPFPKRADKGSVFGFLTKYGLLNGQVKLIFRQQNPASGEHPKKENTEGIIYRYRGYLPHPF